MKNYYTPSACDKLINNLYYATDSIKYLLNCPRNHKDNHLITPELLAAYSDLADACKDVVNAYNYYSKAKHYEAADNQELVDITAKGIANILIEQGRNPTEALAAVKKMFETEG